jgi:hypothetical protein
VRSDTSCPAFTAWTTGVSNPVRSPRFRASASVVGQEAAFATGVRPGLYGFHPYSGTSASLSDTPSTAVSCVIPRLSRGLSHRTRGAAYAPFTPSNSGQRSPPTSYRGCWHVVSRGLLVGYRHHRPPQKAFTPRRASSATRRHSVRVAPIAKIP